MSRESKEDFLNLCDFIKSFSLANTIEQHSFKKLLATQHRHYLALLIIIAEYLEQNLTETTNPKHSLPESQQLDFFCEAASDVGQAFFCWIHGGYKGSRIILRSSIELFIKGMSCEHNPNVLTEKNLYKVFEEAKTTEPFITPTGKLTFNTLHQKYSKLSSDVHKSTVVSSSKISALSHFPNFENSEAHTTSEHFISISTHITLLLCTNFNEAFHKMHHRNKEIVIESLPAKHRRQIQNID